MLPGADSGDVVLGVIHGILQGVVEDTFQTPAWCLNSRYRQLPVLSLFTIRRYPQASRRMDYAPGLKLRLIRAG
jgi:hypothetical protein